MQRHDGPTSGKSARKITAKFLDFCDCTPAASLLVNVISHQDKTALAASLQLEKQPTNPMNRCDDYLLLACT
jgi:hypothetical protein